MDNSFLRAASTLLLLNNYNESQPLEFCYDENMWLYHHEIFFCILISDRFASKFFINIGTEFIPNVLYFSSKSSSKIKNATIQSNHHNFLRRY